MKDPHRQVGLRAGTVEMVANLPDEGLRPGFRLTLRGPDVDSSVWWTVKWVSSHVREKSSLKTYWHNDI